MYENILIFSIRTKNKRKEIEHTNKSTGTEKEARIDGRKFSGETMTLFPSRAGSKIPNTYYKKMDISHMSASLYSLFPLKKYVYPKVRITERWRNGEILHLLIYSPGNCQGLKPGTPSGWPTDYRGKRTQAIFCSISLATSRHLSQKCSSWTHTSTQLG